MPIHFCGDVTIDNYEFYGVFAPARDPATNPGGGRTRASKGAGKGTKENFEKIIARQFGGAHLLHRFTTAALTLWRCKGGDGKNQPIKDLSPWAEFKKDHVSDFLNPLFWSPREFDAIRQVSYRVVKCDDKQYRVPRAGHEGFTPAIPRLASRGSPSPHKSVIAPVHLVIRDSNNIRLFVLNDGGELAREDKNLLSFNVEAGKQAKPDWIVIKIFTSQEKTSNPLLQYLARSHHDRLIGILSADQLRKAGAPISRSLSWEHTLQDTIEQIESRDMLGGHIPRRLVITFDYDAALYLRMKANGKVESGTLIFSINGSEGEFASKISGDMPGAESIFVSVFSALLYDQQAKKRGKGRREIEKMDKIFSYALIAKRRFLQSGFDTDGENPFLWEETSLPKKKEVAESARLFYSDGIFSLPVTRSKPKKDSEPTEEQKNADAPNPLVEKEKDEDSEPTEEQKNTDAPNPLVGKEKDETAKKRRDFFHPLERDDGAFASDLKAEDLERYELSAELLRSCRNKDRRKEWSIFNDVFASKKRSDFIAYVVDGKPPERVPVGQFGKIRTTDVDEIEGLRTIRKLVQTYLSSNTTKPLGIAVFGPPGTGKGFSVKNILDNLPEHLKNLVKDDRHECNLTALSEPEDLAHYFQLARNSVLRGKVPVLFFDEFDCTVNGTEFFWLKHFLAPLQDGEFRYEHIVHPIGRAIFVFAGGVRQTFAEFQKDMDDNQKPEPKGRRKNRTIRTAGKPNFKGVDFLSRLHGYFNVRGLSPSEKEIKERKAELFFGRDRRSQRLIDASYLMRRTFVLRSMLEAHTPKIFAHGTDGQANIDEDVIRVMLATRVFRHGARSMEAIIRMSSLEGSDRFEVAHLPPDSQLEIHADAENFKSCLEEDEANWTKAQPKKRKKTKAKRTK